MFKKEKLTTPTSIGQIMLTLVDKEDGSKKATFRLAIHDQDGNRCGIQRGDLLPHITGEERLWLLDFMDRLREKAHDAIIVGS